ncbi:hypothetical protein [Streptomyces sp. NPDC096324]|uniref:hypothetical protein n=1 Tax=Streptomyces sp. NPDC096324 TaxID=3366085 RepID=UPI0037F1A9CD
MTGWVHDESGQVWCYFDPDTWAIDMDDAGSGQSGGTGDQPDPATRDPAIQGQDPAAGDPAADDEEDPTEPKKKGRRWQ